MFLKVVLLIVSLLLIAVVFLQEPYDKGMGSIFGTSHYSGGSKRYLQGADNKLQKITVILAIVFGVISIVLLCV